MIDIETFVDDDPFINYYDSLSEIEGDHSYSIDYDAHYDLRRWFDNRIYDQLKDLLDESSFSVRYSPGDIIRDFDQFLDKIDMVTGFATNSQSLPRLCIFSIINSCAQEVLEIEVHPFEPWCRLRKRGFDWSLTKKGEELSIEVLKLLLSEN